MDTLISHSRQTPPDLSNVDHIIAFVYFLTREALLESDYSMRLL